MTPKQKSRKFYGAKIDRSNFETAMPGLEEYIHEHVFKRKKCIYITITVSGKNLNEAR